ncbi:BtpA/SgcQ family protein [Agrobacterium larrymoorei]|uniref:Membrane complex biogenesis BtpA family protein n=1 Tax=Agrobacterium larrymoorei TaxID=160699 RepID=A0ABU0UMC0_9HYPH|nr:BtpA/SgcQ family protein [Agrobacterium larrymoorei]MDQ1186006.1 membrane complex biogenesis BtpA family protein [Agrobacterium larrymoorei]
MQWLQKTFNVEKPIIAMCHFQALPGDPGYDAVGGMTKVIDKALADLVHLQEGGVDAIMFSNEFSLPYLTKVRPETTAAMARMIGEMMPSIKVPFGVNVLWDPIASIDLAAATGAVFIREIMSGVYASDFGLWNTNVGETIRHKIRLAPDLKMLFNIVPEAASYLGNRTIIDIARSTVFNNRPDALCVSGLTAGVETDTQILASVKKAVPDTVVLCNTGCRIDNVERQLSVSDGAVVGSTFKIDGVFENAVDPARVKAFMDKVKSIRSVSRAVA